MNLLKHLGLAACATAALVAAASADDAVIPVTPAGVKAVVSAQPFELETPAVHNWRAERPQYTSGYLMVLEVDPRYVVPRAVAEPVLYVGNQTAHRINQGSASGHVVVIVPGNTTDRTAPDYIDLEKALVFFGNPELPEQVDRNWILAEQRDALRSGVTPLGAERATLARQRGGETMVLRSANELIVESVRLIERHSPQEKLLIEQLRPSVSGS